MFNLLLSLFQVSSTLTSHFMAYLRLFSDDEYEVCYLLSLYLCSRASVIHENIEQFQILRSAEHSEDWRIVSLKSIVVPVCVARHFSPCHSCKVLYYNLWVSIISRAGFDKKIEVGFNS